MDQSNACAFFFLETNLESSFNPFCRVSARLDERGG